MKHIRSPCACHGTLLCHQSLPTSAAVKMVTGDQQLIGAETARQLGMGSNIHKIEVLLKVSSMPGMLSMLDPLSSL